MEFIQHTYHLEDTIAALATPPGEGGIAVIRISGKQAVEIADRIFTGSVKTYASHTAHFGHVIDKAGKKIDEVVLIPFLGSRSFTGEDTIEIQCHGGVIISRQVLETVFEAGARSSSPGEFTFRAFMNGKMDLAQAESVQKLISAKCEKALNIALRQLEGALSRKLETLNTKLLSLTSTLEAYIDFPEEGIDFSLLDDTAHKLQEVESEIEKMVSSFSEGKKIEQGILLCIIGAPNVGKSSLMNALLEKERAIVTPIAGTTRDLVEDTFTLNGLFFRLTDTAGIRSTEEPIEKEGIRRTKEAWQKADLILLVLDAHKGIGEEEKLFLKDVDLNKTVVVWNKMDLVDFSPAPFAAPNTIAVSAKEKLGLVALKKLIEKVALQRPVSGGEMFLTSTRHHELLKKALEACASVSQGLKEERYPELLVFELRLALAEIGKILGKDVTENILSTIFSKFCIGK